MNYTTVLYQDEWQHFHERKKSLGKSHGDTFWYKYSVCQFITTNITSDRSEHVAWSVPLETTNCKQSMNAFCFGCYISGLKDLE